MEFKRKYGVAFDIEVPMIKAGARDFAATGDWTPASGDVKISKDGGAFANITTLPVALGNTWTFAVSATEAQAARIVISVVDSATKAVEDQQINISTFGNASALLAPDFSDGVRLGLTALPNAAANATGGLGAGVVRGGTAQAGAAGTITLDASASATDDFYNGCLVFIVSGTGAGQSRIISDYVGSTKVATVGSNWATNPDATSVFAIFALPGVIAASTPTNFSSLSIDASGRVDVGKVGGTAQTAGDLAALLTTIDDYIDTEIAAIKAKTDNLPTDPADESLIIAATDAIMTRLGAPAGVSVSADVAAVKTDTAAVKTKTDSLTFTKANEIDANVQSINGVTVTGDGSTTPFGV